MPALHRRGVVVARHVRDVRHERIELRRIGKSRRVPFLRRPERRSQRVALHRHGVDHLRTVDREDIATAGAVEVHVAHAPPAAKHRLRRHGVGEAQTRSPIVAIGIDERAIVNRSVRRLNHLARVGIPVGEDVVALPLRRGVLVAKAEIQRQPVAHPHVVLQIEEVHVLTEIRDEHVAERVLRAETQHEVGEVVEVARRRGRGTRERARVHVEAVQRVHVLHFGVDALEFVAGLDRLASHERRVVHLRIEDRRVLPLRVRGLAAEPCVARDGLRRQSAGDARVARQPGDAVLVERARRAQRRRILACPAFATSRIALRGAMRCRARRCCPARAACSARRWCRCRRRPRAAEPAPDRPCSRSRQPNRPNTDARSLSRMSTLPPALSV